MTDEDGTLLFDPQACAELHNKLVQYACNADPTLTPRIRHNVFEMSIGAVLDDSDPREPISADELRDRLGDELVEFLESINVFDPADALLHQENQRGQRLTPISLMPHLPSIWTFAAECCLAGESLQNAILLYQGTECCDTTGGLFFDPYTQLARWFEMPFHAENQDDWIPLDEVLRRWVNLWEAGRFVDLQRVVDWAPADVDASIAAWDELLNAVESKIAKDVNEPATSFESMVDDEILEKWYAPEFTRTFFKQARRPRQSVKFIAPGITFFDNVSFESLHEVPDTPERTLVLQRKREEGDPIPLLIFPAHASEAKLTVPQNGFERVRQYPIQNQTAGLYYMEGNGVNLIDGKARSDAFQRGTPCPWMPTRYTSLAEMLRAFSDMIEKGYWIVGRDGVEGGLGWFNGDEGKNERGQRATHWIDKDLPLKKSVADGSLIELKLFWGPDIDN